MTLRTQTVAVAALSASLITLQVLLTRIFSVVFMSHLGFAAISLGMLGQSAAGVRIYLSYRDARAEDVSRLVAKHCFAMVPLTLLSVWAFSHLGAKAYTMSWQLMVSLTVSYVVCVGPFYAGGVALSLLLTKGDTRHFGRLYAYDLMGAAVGGLIALVLLPLFGGPGATIVTAAAVGLVGALVAGRRETAMRKQCFGAVAACVLALVADASMGTFHLHNPKGREAVNSQVLMEKWNAFSRVAVYSRLMPPWSVGPKFHGQLPNAMLVDIDSSAATSIARLSDPKQVEMMSYELTSLGYFAAQKGTALVIGAGGGRDVMSALQFGQTHVDAVEINPIIVNDVMLGAFADRSDNLYRDPRVSVHVQDGRSFVRGEDTRYDSIQLSLVDTWAATSAGAFALAENNLYTREALGDYVDHLKPDGVLTFARWSGFEVLRLLVELEEVCKERGIEDFGRHIALVETHGMRLSVTNLIFRRSPFDAATVRALNEQIDYAGFTWFFNPTWTLADHPGIETQMMLSGDVAAVASSLVGAPLLSSTDDWPFFFMRPNPHVLQNIVSDPAAAVTKPFYLLLWVTLLSAVAAAGAIFVPLSRGTHATSLDRIAAFSVAPYFAFVGLGFMMTEVCMSQRFVLYLGHPTYALTVVLTSLLLGAGIGSWITARLPEDILQAPLHLKRLGLAVVVMLLASSVIHTVMFAYTGSASFFMWVIFSVLSILPVAVLLGMCLPSAMVQLSAHNTTLVTWAWSVNGFFSVIGSCLGALCATGFGFAFTAKIAAGLYALSALVAPTRMPAEIAKEESSRAVRSVNVSESA